MFVIELRDSFVSSIVQTVMSLKELVGLCSVFLKVQSVRIFRRILHTPYTVGACALTSILPSLSLTDMVYCRADTKATPASVQSVGVDS
jgi:hypothetical protein